MRTYVLNLLHPSGIRVRAEIAADDFDDLRRDYEAARRIDQPMPIMSRAGSANLGELIDLAAFDAIDIAEIREPAVPA